MARFVIELWNDEQGDHSFKEDHELQGKAEDRFDMLVKSGRYRSGAVYDTSTGEPYRAVKTFPENWDGHSEE